MPHVRTAAALLAIGALTGCSGTGSAGNDTTVRAGNPDACPGEIVAVVVSVGQWGDVVAQLGGDCAEVTTIVTGSGIDPHDFEPGTADLAAFTGADLVVLNGADYDSWADSVVETLDDDPAVLSAADVAGVTSGEDPHLWYDPAIVERMSAAITQEFVAASPDSAVFFADRAQAWDTALQPYRDAIEALRAVAAGRTYAATETVFDRMAAAVGLTDLTPEGYRRAVSNEGEPTPGDLAAFAAVLSDGKVDALVQNVQTEGELAATLVSAARDGGVPSVEVTESQPEAGGSFVEWQVAQLQELTRAVGAAP